MEDQKKFGVEFKQTPKGFWYVGSLRIDTDTQEEFERLASEMLRRAKEKVESLNSGNIIKAKEKKEIILNSEEEKIFGKLKELRWGLSAKDGLPPYVIFHDFTLKKLIKERPKSKEKAIEIMGEKKYEKYGELFLREIFNFN